MFAESQDGADEPIIKSVLMLTIIFGICYMVMRLFDSTERSMSLSEYETASDFDLDDGFGYLPSVLDELQPVPHRLDEFKPEDDPKTSIILRTKHGL